MICGIDEAGRGCLAGALVVVGCILKEPIASLNDSKKLSSKKREVLYELLHVKADFMVIHFSNKDVDTLGLSVCLKRALELIKKRFSWCEIIFDGNTNFGVSQIKAVVKADTKVPEVSAASIIAKVTRDKIMQKMDKKYPQYNFASHKGYGTALHVKQIDEFGYCDLHRKSFKIKSLQQKSLF